MSWSGNCTRCGEPTAGTRDPGYSESDYVRDESGHGTRHILCPPEIPGSESWLWKKHSFIWDAGCGREDCDESCYDEGHLSYAEEARTAGFGSYPDFDDPQYQRWLLSTFGPPQQLVQVSLPASASPIEQQFWGAHIRLSLPELTGLVPQHKAGPYRMDFALPSLMIGIELEGLRNHSKTEDIARDCLRQRWLQWLGWRIIRIGGKEVYHDAGYCVRQVADFAGKWSAS